MEASVKCKHCGKSIHTVTWTDGPEWIHDMEFYGCEDEENNAEPSDPVAQGITNIAIQYYDKQFINNLKAQTPFKTDPVGGVQGQVSYSYTYSYSPKTGMVPITPPETPKKALPKAVDIPNGRKFRDEE